MTERSHTDDLRGVTKLVIDATTGVMELVQAMHVTVAGGPALLGTPLAAPAGALLRPGYETARGVTRLVGGALDLLWARLTPVLGASSPWPQREALLAGLNGTLGDYLTATGNPLALRMRLRHGGRPLVLERRELARAFDRVTSKVVVLVHGSSLSDASWSRRGHSHGAALAKELGYTPVAVHYNTGLHVSINGRELARQLQRLTAAWPVELREISLLGHSMGGLVARSACHFGARRAWRAKLSSLVCLGAPHHGAPLERAGHWVDLLIGISRYSAPFARLGRLRSAGVTDLRFGNVRDEDWEGRDRFAWDGDTRKPLPLPKNVDCFAIAGTTAKQPGPRLPGDGLVPVHSALGKHARKDLTLAFPQEHQWIAYGAGHLDLLDRRDVYEQMRDWLGSR